MLMRDVFMRMLLMRRCCAMMSMRDEDMMLLTIFFVFRFIYLHFIILRCHYAIA